MAMPAEAIAELEKLVKKARQKDLPFGLCLGKKPEDNVMVLDLKKGPEVLMRSAKKDGETGKVTYGTVGVKGKIMSLTLEGKMLPGLAKNMKVFMSKIGIKMKVVILDETGAELDSDGDEDLDLDATDSDDIDVDLGETTESAVEPEEQVIPEAPPAPEMPSEETAKAAEPTETEDPQKAKWAKLQAAFDPKVKAFAASGHPKAAAIAKAWDGGVAAGEQGNYKIAFAVAEKIKPAVEAATQAETTATDAQPEAAPAASTDPNAAKWAKIHDPIEALYLEVMKLNPPDASKLRTIWMAATESAIGEDFTKAIAIATRIKPMLDAAKAAGVSEQDEVIPADIVPFQKSKMAWESARGKMRDEVGKLVDAIKAACAADDELKSVADSADDLHKQLESLDDRLDDALNTVINAPIGPQRVAAMQNALKAIENLQSNLQQPFFQDVDSNNGFKSVKVTETAVKSLTAISKIIDTQAKAAA